MPWSFCSARARYAGPPTKLWANPDALCELTHTFTIETLTRRRPAPVDGPTRDQSCDAPASAEFERGSDGAEQPAASLMERQEEERQRKLHAQVSSRAARDAMVASGADPLPSCSLVLRQLGWRPCARPFGLVHHWSAGFNSGPRGPQLTPPTARRAPGNRNAQYSVCDAAELAAGRRRKGART